MADHDRPLLGHVPMSPGAAGLVIFDELARQHLPPALQVGAFDTAFHAGLLWDRIEPGLC